MATKRTTKPQDEAPETNAVPPDYLDQKPDPANDAGSEAAATEVTVPADMEPGINDTKSTEPAPSSDYVASEPLLHDGKKYAPGRRVPGLTDEQAERLLKAGVIIQGIR
jgi:hypothetical protein